MIVNPRDDSILCSSAQLPGLCCVYSNKGLSVSRFIIIVIIALCIVFSTIGITTGLQSGPKNDREAIEQLAISARQAFSNGNLADTKSYFTSDSTIHQITEEAYKQDFHKIAEHPNLIDLVIFEDLRENALFIKTERHLDYIGYYFVNYPDDPNWLTISVRIAKNEGGRLKLTKFSGGAIQQRPAEATVNGQLDMNYILNLIGI